MGSKLCSGNSVWKGYAEQWGVKVEGEKLSYPKNSNDLAIVESGGMGLLY